MWYACWGFSLEGRLAAYMKGEILLYTYLLENDQFIESEIVIHQRIFLLEYFLFVISYLIQNICTNTDASESDYTILIKRTLYG